MARRDGAVGSDNEGTGHAGHVVLRGVDLDVEPHQVAALIGASGSGKSTLLRCINLLETVDDGEIWLRGLHIPEYSHGTWTNHEPRRTRKLLLHKREILRLIGKTKESGTSLVPLSMYFKDGKVKVELALARGKKAHDKRQAMAKRDADREIQKVMGRAAKRGMGARR